jgi:3-deoxy-D-manno-octulosonate 8-phosphate phosphatase (KDO 8-P phosphatase)
MNKDPLQRLAADIALVIFDVDGVFTDGRLFFGPDGESIKVFHVRDGYGVKRLAAAGVTVAIISGRSSTAVARRMAELGIEHVFQGDHDKVPLYERLIGQLGVPPDAVAYMGDDLPDLPVMQRVGLPAAPANADPAVLAASRWTATRGGGEGAVREFCDFLLAARGGGAT